jgi:hypothetical protein
VLSGVLGNQPRPVGGLADKATTARPSPKRPAPGASTKQLGGRPNTVFGSTPSPASVAARLRSLHPGGMPNVDVAAAAGGAGRRIAGSGPISGGAGGAAGTARMGGRTTRKDAWGDGMINEEDRGSAHDM